MGLRCTLISAALSVVAFALSTTLGSAQIANIVGLGAATCQEFNRDVERSFHIQRDYFTWAQGFMSGILLRAPPGVEGGLELNPSKFPLLEQVKFLRSFCETNPGKDYSDAVIAALAKLLGYGVPSLVSVRIGGGDLSIIRKRYDRASTLS